jgi:hypothetical protein
MAMGKMSMLRLHMIYSCIVFLSALISLSYLQSVQLSEGCNTYPTDTTLDHHLMLLPSASHHLRQSINHPNDNTDWWSNHVAEIARPFGTFQGLSKYGWCIPELHPTHNWRIGGEKAVGLLYIKTYKASSSTLEGIAVNIAQHVAKRHFSSKRKPCVHYHRHEFADLAMHEFRDEPKSLLWTFLRAPPKRDLSSVFFFDVSRHGMEPTDSNLLQALLKLKSFQTRFLAPWSRKNQIMEWDNRNDNTTLESRVEVVAQIVERYDFLGIVERMEESLAVMKLLWELETSDLIVLAAKRAGGFDDAGSTGICTKIQKSHASPLIQHYLKEAHMQDNTDYLLYAAANASLDRTIQTLGQAKVQAVVEEIRFLQKLANDQCSATAIFPCSSEGQAQLQLASKSCYVQDAGCGHMCVDRVMEQYKKQ